MKIEVPIKLHNKFEIEVYDVVKEEQIQKGYAENIVLTQAFNNMFRYDKGTTIHVGSGTGTLEASRTSLFSYLAKYNSERVEAVWNYAPTVSYATKKITIPPSALVGETITEVGFAEGDTLSTHALIKDSEGNPLALGPKTDTQEITIYGTVYFQPNLEPGLQLAGTLEDFNNRGNGLLPVGTFWRGNNIGYSPFLIINGVEQSSYYPMSQDGVYGAKTSVRRLNTGQNNGKIKNVELGSLSYYANNNSNGVIEADVVALAQNNSTLWGGHNFLQRDIGIGDGTTVTFTLPWDEARLDKAKAVYVDGVEQTSGVTWTSSSITFDSAPADQSVITADYWVDYIPKDTDHVLDIQFKVTFGEGSAT